MNWIRMWSASESENQVKFTLRHTDQKPIYSHWHIHVGRFSHWNRRWDINGHSFVDRHWYRSCVDRMCRRHLTIVQRVVDGKSGICVDQWTDRYQNHRFLHSPKKSNKLVSNKRNSHSECRLPLSLCPFLGQINFQKKNSNSSTRGTDGNSFDLINESVSSLRVPFITHSVNFYWIRATGVVDRDELAARERFFTTKVIVDSVAVFRVAHCVSLHQHSPRQKDNDLTVTVTCSSCAKSVRNLLWFM